MGKDEELGVLEERRQIVVVVVVVEAGQPSEIANPKGCPWLKGNYWSLSVDFRAGRRNLADASAAPTCDVGSSK